MLPLLQDMMEYSVRNLDMSGFKLRKEDVSVKLGDLSRAKETKVRSAIRSSFMLVNDTYCYTPEWPRREKIAALNNLSRSSNLFDEHMPTGVKEL